MALLHFLRARPLSAKARPPELDNLLQLRHLDFGHVFSDSLQLQFKLLLTQAPVVPVGSWTSCEAELKGN